MQGELEAKKEMVN
jgi:chromosome segregation ATPase